MKSKSVEDLLPNLRAQARLWTTTIEEADDIVCLALEMAIEQAATNTADIEEWLSDLLVTARDIHLGTTFSPCRSDTPLHRRASSRGRTH